MPIFQEPANKRGISNHASHNNNNPGLVVGANPKLGNRVTIEVVGNVVGTTQLFDQGRMRYIPTPTPDPKDPLNLPQYRKYLAIGTLCFFGALAMAAEIIIGALIPVFVLEYSNIPVSFLTSISLPALASAANNPTPVNPIPHSEGTQSNVNIDPLSMLKALGGPPVEQVALLASIPLLVNGIASYLLVPLSICIGRRPVLLLSGLCAWAGGLAASFTQGLIPHIVCRCFQGLGAGAVEALIPLVMQDMMFIHERNSSMAAIGASQGLIIVGLGIASPVIVARLSWRVIYWVTSGAGFVAWVMVGFLVPETRWVRSAEELAGKQIYPLAPNESRPRIDRSNYTPRTFRSNFTFFSPPFLVHSALHSFVDTIKTTLFPTVLWAICVNSLFVCAQGATGQVGSAILIAGGWEFERLGLALLPFLVASPFVWFFGGYFADKVSNWVARRNGGTREPEAHLLSLVIPLLAGIAGPALFGYIGESVGTDGKAEAWMVLVAIFLIGFGLVTANALFSVYIVESYPQYAGPVLVNVSSLRLIVGFATSFKVTRWIQDIGFMKTFGIYSLCLTGVSLFLPVMYIYGKPLRAWTSGMVQPSSSPTTGPAGLSPPSSSSLGGKGKEAGEEMVVVNVLDIEKGRVDSLGTTSRGSRVSLGTGYDTDGAMGCGFVEEAVAGADNTDMVRLVNPASDSDAQDGDGGLEPGRELKVRRSLVGLAL